METLILPELYHSKLNIIETEQAIKNIKDTFEKELAKNLNLVRVSAPLFLRPETGLNDDLNGVERAVEFDVRDINSNVQIIHSLAKWKRFSLKKYEFFSDSGIYTDMNAIRRDEKLDNIHSIYVDQWDWEKIINRNQRNMEYLKETVEKIMLSLSNTQKKISGNRYQTEFKIPEKIHFISSQDLEDMYPGLPPKERENRIAKTYGAVFISQIGGKLKSGIPHDGRAPDYDDWNLNGDIIIWYPLLQTAVELSSMGIRVDEESLRKQLKEAGCEERGKLEFHKELLSSKLPLTIGGGIGQSRMCMLLLQKAHIGEVQASVWPDEMISLCSAKRINLL